MTDTTVGGTTGGAETYLWNLLSRLDQSLYSIDIIYFDTVEAEMEFTDHDKGKIQGITYFRIPIRRIYAPSSLKYLKEISRIIKNGNYDCAMSFFESSDIVLAILGKVFGIKNIISNRRDTGFRTSKKLAFAYRFINKLFTSIIAVSDAVKQTVIDQGVKPEKIHVIHNGVDIHRFKNSIGTKIREELEISSEAIIFGLVANLYPVKNHTSLIEALAELHLKGKQAHLILAGDGESRKELEDQVEKSNLTSHVHFLGERLDIENILAAIDIFVLSSHSEGLSNALLEAMAARKPVIATRVGGNIDVVENNVNGLLVSTKASSIAVAMETLHDSEELRKEMGENAYLHAAEQFSMEKMLNNYMKVFSL